MEVRGQPHEPAAFHSGEERHVCFGGETSWAPSLLCITRKLEKILAPAWNQTTVPACLTHKLVSVPTK